MAVKYTHACLFDAGYKMISRKSLLSVISREGELPVLHLLLLLVVGPLPSVERSSTSSHQGGSLEHHSVAAQRFKCHLETTGTRSLEHHSVAAILSSTLPVAIAWMM